MFTLFAHAGHSHSAASMTMLDHCLPIIIGAGIIITLLGGALIFLLVNWKPKKAPVYKKTKNPKN